MTQTERMNLLAETVVKCAGARHLTIATAESCTGGMIGAALTDVPGASAVFDRGFITYSNEAKSALLGVPQRTIERYGAVSAQTARAMAAGALTKAGVDVAVSVTGIAGPDGGGPDKPVGLVWFGLAQAGKPVRIERRVFAGGGRGFVRSKAAETGLRLLLQAVSA